MCIIFSLISRPLRKRIVEYIWVPSSIGPKVTPATGTRFSYPYFLVSQARPGQPTPALGLACKITLLAYPSVNRSASFHAIWALSCLFMPFGLFIYHLASFQAVWLALKSFGLVSKWDHFALYNWKWPNQFKNGWPVYKPVARLQTGQVCN